MEIIDNVNVKLHEAMRMDLHKGSKVSIAAAYFSIYAFEKLKKELKNIDKLRFVFTEPTFNAESSKKEKREFYIPRLNRERGIYGTEFEVRLRNELTQKAIARECAEWLKDKAIFKSNNPKRQIPRFMLIDDKSYIPINGFTTTELGYEQGNDAFFAITKMEAPMSMALMQNFALAVEPVLRCCGRMRKIYMILQIL